MKKLVTIALMFITLPCFAHRQRHHHRHGRHHSHHSRHAHVRQHVAPQPLTAADILSQQFEENKGKLPMPVNMTATYTPARQSTVPVLVHPQVLGIDIPTVPNTSVHSVYDGVVSHVFSAAGSEQIIIVQHGHYFSVYNGLSTTCVKSGQHVAAGEEMGVVALNDDGIPSLNFQLWKGATKEKKGTVKENTRLDPRQWLRS